MDEITKPFSYEIAYLLSPNIETEHVLTAAGDVTKAIESVGGTIQYVAEPKRRKLAFPIKKAEQAYFGYTDFMVPASKILLLKKGIELQKNILRYLVVKPEKVSRRSKERTYARPFVKREVHPTYTKKPEARSEEKIDIGEIDKRLDEILNK